jgi:hypothetical protein
MISLTMNCKKKLKEFMWISKKKHKILESVKNVVTGRYSNMKYGFVTVRSSHEGKVVSMLN